MLTFIKWATASAVALLAICVTVHPHCRPVVFEITLEGLAGGLMVGLVLAFSKLERLRHREWFTLTRAICLVRHELCAGLVGGLLVALGVALVRLLA
jgi:hypothetical protein